LELRAGPEDFFFCGRTHDCNRKQRAGRLFFLGGRFLVVFLDVRLRDSSLNALKAFCVEKGVKKFFHVRELGKWRPHAE